MNKEIWFTTTTKGARSAWKYNTRAMRSFRLPMAQAEFEIATGASVEIQRPSWLGGK